MNLLVTSFLTLSLVSILGCSRSSNSQVKADDKVKSVTDFEVPVYSKKNDEQDEKAKVSAKSDDASKLEEVAVTYNGKTITLVLAPNKGDANPISGERTGQTLYFVDDVKKPTLVLGLQFHLLTKKLEGRGDMVDYSLGSGKEPNSDEAQSIDI